MNEGAGTIRLLDLTARRWRTAALIQLIQILVGHGFPVWGRAPRPALANFPNLEAWDALHEGRKQKS